MTVFQVGDRVEVIRDIDGLDDTYIGRQGSVCTTPDRNRTSFIEVELDGDNGIMYFYPDELVKLGRNKPFITRDELNHERAQYQTTIDNLNELLDEIQEMLSSKLIDSIDPDWIQGILDKRPGMP